MSNLDTSSRGRQKCLPLYRLVEFAESPDAWDTEEGKALEEHLEYCDVCSTRLEVAVARLARQELYAVIGPPQTPRGSLLRTFDICLNWFHQQFARLHNAFAISIPKLGFATLFVVLTTGATIGGGLLVARLNNLADEIDRLKLDKIVVPWGPEGLVVDGNDTIKVHVDVVPAYVQTVRVNWGSVPDGPYEVLYEGSEEPYRDAPRVTIQKTSPPYPLTGRRDITARLEVVPYEEARRQFPQFFPEGPFKRVFRLTPDGITVDPRERIAVATLERIRVSEDDPHLYICEGTAYRRAGAAAQAYLIIEPVQAAVSTVGAAVPLSSDGRFAARCFLGTKVDRQEYRVYVVVADRPDPASLPDGMQVPGNVDWAELGYVKSDARKKINDGTDGFDDE